MFHVTGFDWQSRALKLYATQLALNFLWPIVSAENSLCSNLKVPRACAAAGGTETFFADSATLKPCTDFLQLAEACAVLPGERGPAGHGSRHHGSVLQDPAGGWSADAPIRHLVGVACGCWLYPALADVKTFRRY